MKYELFYWPGIQGRGEFVRLVLEEAGADYVDVARLSEDDGGGVRAIRRLLDSDVGAKCFAPPILRHQALTISQTANICAWLAARHGLVGDDEPSRLHANQHQLTIADFVDETHDTHHPVATSEYYEDQKEVALRRARAFRDQRMPKFLGVFERALDEAGGDWLLGTFSYVDLSMFQMLRGLEYAFPNACERHAGRFPLLRALADRVAARDAVASYLESERRIPFNENGIFRHYPELDD